ncbi:AP-5 complex subunit sigma-1-like isoform X1 [Montipora foliosa]|uniref:AP-5 complex subunit sigma-1-like isoform X1 n=1 Tax=Montipora foliosa TaxID=591990 RepID=UPI0035F170CD
MVHGFLIHSLSPGPCRVLFSSTFIHETLPDGQHLTVQDERERRKLQLLQVAQRVQSEYSFQYVASASSISSAGDMSGLLSTEELLSHLKAGVFRLPCGNPFKVERVVLWRGLANSGFALICEKDENRLVAENILNLIIRHLQEYCQIILQPSEAILKADKVTAIIHHFLPEGQLLFMNNRFLRQVEKDLEQVMNTK